MRQAKDLQCLRDANFLWYTRYREGEAPSEPEKGGSRTEPRPPGNVIVLASLKVAAKVVRKFPDLNCVVNNAGTQKGHDLASGEPLNEQAVLEEDGN